MPAPFPCSDSFGKRFAYARGFTLVELVVVMALFGIMMMLAIPNLQHFLTDDTRKASQWIQLQAPILKSKAVSEKTTYVLHADMDDNLLWYSNSAMDDDMLMMAKEQAFALHRTVFLTDVLYANGEVVDSGEAAIHFYPQGYSDRAIIHLEEEGGAQRSFFIEPFLKQIDIKEGYVDFED